MTPRIDLPGLHQLINQQAQLVEVLPAAEYAEVHHPGAINPHLKQPDNDTAANLDR
jgi:hypothetical protein